LRPLPTVSAVAKWQVSCSASMIRGLNKIACSLIELIDKQTRYMMKLEQIKLCQ